MPRARLTSKERRVQILRDAAKVFAERGLSETRTRDLAKACGVNEAVLYHHFESKDQIFRESFQFIQQDLIDELALIAKSAPDGFTALRETMRRHILGLIEDPVLRAYLFQGFASLTQDDEMFEWVRSWCSDQHDFAHMMIVRGVKDGSIREDIHVDSAVWHLKGVMWASILAAMLDMDTGNIGEMSLNLVEQVIDEMKA